ncbi:hypothetical protein TWF696_004541 [Orbilia brochopaga]|uniref:Mediator of RNA polymerase II transcription subunit 4 n=1 Tax=Orbilia brochopaga TaxID=3140254 RepID=A0AAV9V7N6_9PEZI
MNAVLLKSLDAIEASLAGLLESIAVDDPSAGAAAALVAADDAFSASLTQLVTHQTNHQRLLHLRALSAALDSELSALLTTLSAARAELLSAPTSIFPEHARPVEYGALLSYANKISKFTRPPTHLKPATTTATTATAATASGDSTSTSVVKADSNGANVDPAKPEGTGNAATRPTAEDIALLDPSANMPFAPWPSEEIMKRGILANLGYLDAVPDAAAAETSTQPDSAQPQAASAAPTGNADRQPTAADRERQREEIARREAERKAKEQEVFQGLDLYDPDSD